MARENTYEVIPSARRLITSLRDMGYDFAAAVADLVDNSIEAKAREVVIDVVFDGPDSWVRIADDGIGMSPEELREAMRYGADREYDTEDLGKFGLGLKTASMSQCARLTVASRRNPDRADIAAYCWDLEHITRTNRWEILPLDRDSSADPARHPLKHKTGTVVLWQRLDRILGFSFPDGEAARKRLGHMCRDLEGHLAMVFHRFLSGEARGGKLRLYLNSNQIRPWDPFCTDEPKTKALERIVLPVQHESARGDITIEPYVLPTREQFSSPEAFASASGPANWNQQQGFYIYRAGRLIQSGGWSRLRAADEHTKLCRVALSFPRRLDEAFKINVAKMRVQLPASVREDIERAVAPAIRIARATYDRKQADGGRRPGGAKRPESDPPSAPRGGAGGKGAHSELSVTEFVLKLRAAARPAERKVIDGVIARMQASLVRDRK